MAHIGALLGMKHVYIAHPLGSDPEQRSANLLAAARWCGMVARLLDVVPVAPWIPLATVWDESMREIGLTIDKAAIERSDALFLLGPRISEGMAIEASHARDRGIVVLDFTVDASNMRERWLKVMGIFGSASLLHPEAWDPKT